MTDEEAEKEYSILEPLLEKYENDIDGIFYVDEINNRQIVKPLVLELQKQIINAYEYIQVLRNKKGAANIDAILAQYARNKDFTLENSVFENNVIFVAQYLKTNEAIGEFNE